MNHHIDLSEFEKDFADLARQEHLSRVEPLLPLLCVLVVLWMWAPWTVILTAVLLFLYKLTVLLMRADRRKWML